VLFAKRTLPILITFVTGVIFAAQYYIPHPFSESLLTEASVWVRIIGGIAVILGVVSLCHVHYVKIRRRSAGWGYSLVVYVAMVATLVAGLVAGGEEKATLFGWIYSNIFISLNATIFSLLAFFMASAAYRSFRARSAEAAVLLAAAIIVMFGRAPLGEYLIADAGLAADWLMNVLNTAARRAILIGVSLGALAISIKIIVGIERTYLGGGE